MSVQAITWVLEHSDSRLGPRHVMISIANHADREGKNAFPSIRTMARESRLSEREVQYALPMLVKLGELKVEKNAGPGCTNLYSLPLMGCKVCVGAKSAPVQTGVQNPARNKEEQKQPSLRSKSISNPRSPLLGGATAAAGIQLTSRDLRNVAKEIRQISEAPAGGMLDQDDILDLACGRYCLNPDDVRIAMGQQPRKKEPAKVSA